VNEFSIKNRWSPDMVARLEDCSLAAASQGLEYRWPLLDIRLINFYLSVPSEYKLNKGIPRYLHRKAIQGLVPGHLIWKDKSMGGPLQQNNSQTNNAMKELFDPAMMQFESLNPVIQKIIDRERWDSTVAKISMSFEEQGNEKTLWQLLPIIQPILSLNEWLNRSKKA